jgi:hypothetical protein
MKISAKAHGIPVHDFISPEKFLYARKMIALTTNMLSSGKITRRTACHLLVIVGAELLISALVSKLLTLSILAGET